MIERPDVAVIMANYNGGRFIAAAIRSVIRQTLTSWELIVVDDASTDDSLTIAADAAAGDPRIKVVAQPFNKGPGAARNLALDLVTASWIAILDSDDLMPPQRLEFLLRRAHSAGAIIIADNLLEFSADSRPRSFVPKQMRRDATWIPLATFIRSNCLYSRIPPLGYLKPMIHTDTVRELGLCYNESLRIGEDYYFLVTLMARGHRLFFEPASVYLYRKHDKSISHRLREEDIVALMAAEKRFVERESSLQRPIEAALRRRKRTLRSFLAYDAIITALKRRDFLRAADGVARHPFIWPMLIRPVTARLRRFAICARLGRRTVEAPEIETLMLDATEAAE